MNVLETTRREVVLKAPYISIFDLKELIQERAQQFFTTTETAIMCEQIRITGESLASSSEKNFSKWRLETGYLPVNFPRSTAKCPTISLYVTDTIQRHRILLHVDLSTFKKSSPNVFQKWESELSIPIDTPDTPIIPSGVPLNRLTRHPNAPYIYNRLFKVVTTYRNILLDILRRDGRWSSFIKSSTFLFPEFSKLCWNTFLPNGSELIGSLDLPLASVQAIGHRVGNFVKEDVFVVLDEEENVVAKQGSIILSYELKKDHLICTDIIVYDSLTLDQTQQAHADYLIKAFGSGKLSLKTYRDHKELVERLEKDAKSIITDSNPNLLPFLHSYHPHHFRDNNLTGILILVEFYGRNLASGVSKRFESAAVKERVFKTEYSTWWSTFIPGSRIRFLSSFEARSLGFKTLPDFNRTILIRSTSTGSQDAFSVSLGIKTSCPTSSTSPKHWTLRTDPVVVEYPDVPLPHDPEQVQRLFKLIAQPRHQ